MTKKILSIFLLVAMMGTVLCGCGGGSTEEQTGNDGNNATTGELVHGGEITVGIAQDLEDSLDPHKTVEAGTKEVLLTCMRVLSSPIPAATMCPLLLPTMMCRKMA